MTRVAVVAHRKKSLDGGLDELRRLLTVDSVDELLWYEVGKSRRAGKKARKARKHGAELVFVWGGDGTVQRCVDALAGSSIPIAIVPAGTANLLAKNLAIPIDLAAAVRIGLQGRRRTLDVGKVNGEHFAVMAGVGFDAQLVAEAGRGLKDRVGRLAYLWTGLRHVRDAPTSMSIRLDGHTWFDGDASCVLLGNVGTITGGIRAFDDAQPDDGWLEVGVTTAAGAVQWARTLGRMAVGRSDRSPFIRIGRAKAIDVKLGRPLAYELDGGVRGSTSRLTAQVVPGGITVCIPVAADDVLTEPQAPGASGDP